MPSNLLSESQWVTGDSDGVPGPSHYATKAVKDQNFLHASQRRRQKPNLRARAPTAGGGLSRTLPAFAATGMSLALPDMAFL